MNDHFALNLLISDERLTTELQKRLPPSLSAGSNRVTFGAPWSVQLEQNGFLINGILAMEHQYRTGINLLANVRFSVFAELQTFPDLKLDFRAIQFIDKPKVQLLGFMNFSIKKMAEKQLKQRLPEIKQVMHKELDEQRQKLWPLLQQLASTELPTGWQIILNGMRWQIEKAEGPGQLQLRPQLALSNDAEAANLHFANPFTNSLEPIAITIQLSLAEINSLLQKNNKNQQIKTPAGVFTLEKITAGVVQHQLHFLVDFVEEKNGQLNLIGELQIIDQGKGVAFEVQQVDWHSVNILKQGLLSLFQQKVKAQINQALQLDQNKIQQLISSQLIVINEKMPKDLQVEIQELIAIPHFQKVSIVKNGLRISATLSGQISAAIE